MVIFTGPDFRLDFPSVWRTVATVDHRAVFVGPDLGGVCPSLAVSRNPHPVMKSARMARADHEERFSGYEVLWEDTGDGVVYRRFARLHHSGVRIIQHQLFVPGFVLTATRAGVPAADSCDGLFGVMLRSFRIRRAA
jgi:hypothetical protein